MSILALAAVFVVVFATSRWSGRTLARHHGDADALPTLGLAGAGAGGLLAGYMRADSVA